MNELDQHLQEIDRKKVINAIKLQLPIEMTSYTLSRNMEAYFKGVCDEFLEVYFITERDMIDEENLSSFGHFVSKECNGSLHIIYIDIDEKLKNALTDNLKYPNRYPLMVFNCILGLFLRYI